MFIRIWAFNFTFYEIRIIRFLKIRCTGDYVPKTLLEKTQSSPHSIIGPHGFHGISACCRLPLSPATNANVSTHIPECSVRRIVSRILIKVHVCGTPWREVKDKRKNGINVYVQARLRGGSLESALTIYTHISSYGLSPAHDAWFMHAGGIVRVLASYSMNSTDSSFFLCSKLLMQNIQTWSNNVLNKSSTFCRFLSRVLHTTRHDW
jgi:hypothetical protein